MSKLVKNWSYLLVSDVIQQLVGFFVVILLARKLSPDGYGLFNVIISIATIFSVVAHFGMSNVVIRELSLKPEATGSFIKKVIVPFRIGSFVLAITAFLIYNSVTLTTDNEWLLYVVLIILNLTLWNFSESIAFGHEVTKYSSILNVIISIGWLISIVIIPENLLNVKTIILVYCLLHFVKALAYLILIIKNFYKPEKFNSSNATVSRTQFFKMVLAYIWLLFIVTLGNQLPIQFLNSNSGLKEVGFYAVGFKLMIPISIAVGTAFKAIFPSLTRLFSKNKLEFENKLKLGFNIILVSGTLIGIVASLTSKFWLTMVFGEEYTSAVVVFNFLIWFSVISILDSLLSNGLSSAYREKVLAIVATIDIIILLPLLFYASYFGAWALAFVKLITGFIFLGYHLYVFVKVLNIKIFNKDLGILLGFYFSAMSICLLIDNGVYQLLSITVLLLIVLTLRDSPIITTYNYVRQTIKKVRLK